MSLLNYNNRRLIPSINSMFDNFFSDDFSKDAAVQRGTSVPAVNVKETDKEYQLELAAPGKSKSDFKIEIENDFISIGSKNEESNDEDLGNYTRKEYSFSAFKRSFKLPENANLDKIAATYDNGILSVSIAKLEPSVPERKTIAIG